MLKDKSYGIVPLRQHGHSWEVFLVQHSKALFWGYPKGHAEGNETPQEAAARELKEETALQVKCFLCDASFDEHYIFTLKGKKISKTVQFFVAEVTGEVQLQAAEVADGKWVPLSDASTVLTYATDREVLASIIKELALKK